MAIVFEANYSKKLGLPGFSSHQYNVTVRVEMADINQVQQESERLYRLLQTCVDREIQQTGFLPVIQSNGSSANGHHNNVSKNNDFWMCSLKQKELILKIVEENHLDKNEVEILAQERFSASVKHLNTMQMSGLIQELLEKYPGEKPVNNRRYSNNAPLERRSR